MWQSYHIYINDYALFLEELSQFKQRLKDSELFFVKYLDPIGVHFRLRIRSGSQSVSELDTIIYDHFNEYRVLKKIYDPEYNIFQDKLAVYEQYSSELTEFLVSRSHSEVFSHYAVKLVEKLLEQFSCNEIGFLKSYINYWSGYARFYNEKDALSLKKELSKAALPKELRNIIERLNQFKNDSRRKELAFKYLHMTLNKLNFTIVDELVIVDLCISDKLQQQK